MKCTVTRSDLLPALSSVLGTAASKATIPILANVHLEAKRGVLLLITTDMDAETAVSIPAFADRAGSITVPAKVMHRIILSLPDGDIDICLNDIGELIVKSGWLEATLVSLPPGDFPRMDVGDVPHRFSMPSAALRRLIDTAKFAISTEETRYYLNGIFLHAAEGDDGRVLCAVATDGHRLARVEEPLPEGAFDMPSVIIPRTTIKALSGIIAKRTGQVQFALSHRRIQFSVDGAQLTSKLIDGTFPDYSRVIPNNNDRILRVGKSVLSSAVEQASSIGRDRSRPVKMSLSRDTMHISGSDSHGGRISTKLNGGTVSYEAVDMEIGFQARYLKDILRQVSENVEFRFGGSGGPVIMLDPSKPSATFVIMPMRV